MFDLDYKFESIGASLLALAKSIYYLSAVAVIRVNTELRGIPMVLSAALKQAPHFWRKNLISFGTFPYALCNLTFTNKLLVKGQNNN